MIHAHCRKEHATFPIGQRRHIANVSVPVITRDSRWLGICSSRRFCSRRFRTSPLSKGAFNFPLRQRSHIAIVSVPVFTRDSRWQGFCSSRRFNSRDAHCGKESATFPSAATSHSDCGDVFSKPRTRSMLRSKRVCLGGHNAPWPSTNTSTTAGVCNRLSRIALLL